VSGTLLALLVAVCAGCSPQAGLTRNGTEVSRGDCTVDLKDICEAFLGQKQFTLNQTQYDARSLEQDSPRHGDLILPYSYPDGTPLAMVRCQFDTVHHTVTSATLASGPAIDDRAIAYIRSQGFCADQAPDYRKAMDAARSPLSSTQSQ
jgi:hypothetical protein